MSFSLRALISLAVLLGTGFGQEQKTVFEETYRVRDRLEFILRSDGGDVQIFRNDRNECSVQITYKEETCRPVVAYNERDRTLSIDVDHKNWSMQSGNLKQSDYALIKIGLPTSRIWIWTWSSKRAKPICSWAICMCAPCG